MQRSYPIRWLALAIGLLGGTQCIDSLSDDCTKTLTCEDGQQPVLGEDCVWRFPGPGNPVWQDGPRYDQSTRRWRWPDGTETDTQSFSCYLTARDAGTGVDTDAGPTSFDCRVSGACDIPLVCDEATGACVECLADAQCAGNMPVGDAGAATVCDLARRECVQCIEDAHCSGDTPVCRVDAESSSRNRCVECQANDDCGGATPICDDATNECTASCTETADCSGDKPACDRDRNLCVECLDDSTCSTEEPFCSTATNQCVECLADAACAPVGEVCNLDSHRCVQCNADTQCQSRPGAAGPYCDTETRLCVACLNDLQCDASDSSRCNTVSHQCVGCNSDSQCEAGTRCNAGVCVQCIDDSHCTTAGLGVCGPAGACVECDATSQCLSADAPHCETVATDNTRFTCVGCTANADCSGKGLPEFCGSSGACVDCLGNNQCQEDSTLSRCQNGTCQVCVTDTDCELFADAPDNAPACKSGTGCVECVSNAHCADTEDTPVCKTAEGGGSAAINTCVECITNADCQTNAAASRCQNNECVGCVADTDCNGVDSNGNQPGGTNLNVCDAGTCVECTGPKRQACGEDVCNSLTRQCAPGRRFRGAESCDACLSDLECQADERCVEQTFGGQNLGFFCFPLATVAGNGASPTCPGPRIFLGATTSPTIDGELPVPAVCQPRRTTCAGIDDNGTSCESDADCGAAALADSLCDDDFEQCTLPCASLNDCAGECDLATGACEL